jgi:hypothetical protein
VTHPVPAQRISIGWQVRRSFSDGNTRSMVMQGDMLSTVRPVTGMCLRTDLGIVQVTAVLAWFAASSSREVAGAGIRYLALECGELATYRTTDGK